MEEIREKKKITPITICLIASYIVLAVGLFLLVYRYRVVPETCNPVTGACVNHPGDAYMETLVPPYVSWIIIGISAAVIVGLNVFNVVNKRNKKEEIEVE